MYDTVTHRPGCVIIQALYNCAEARDLVMAKFLHWETGLTPDMKMYDLPPERIEQLAEMSNTKGAKIA